MRHAVAVVILFLGVGAVAPAAAIAPIVIGAVYPTGGGQGPGGTEEFRGVDLAAEYANRSGERSEEHTSELQSLRHLVCRLLLEKIKERATYAKNVNGTINHIGPGGASGSPRQQMMMKSSKHLSGSPQQHSAWIRKELARTRLP